MKSRPIQVGTNILPLPSFMVKDRTFTFLYLSHVRAASKAHMRANLGATEDMWDEVDRARRGMHSNVCSVDTFPRLGAEMDDTNARCLSISYHDAHRETFSA